MAKVASLSWVELARQATSPAEAAPFHTHFMAPENLGQLAAILNLATAAQTISNRLIVREIWRKGHAAAAALAAAQAAQQPVRLICGMRDPVARSLSLLSFLTDFVGHRAAHIGGRNSGATIEASINLLQQSWHAVYAQKPPEHGFERLLWFLTGSFRNWFSQELRGFDLGLPDGSLPQAQGVRTLRAKNTKALIYRVEDMAPEAPVNAALREAAGRFLGIGIPAWPHINKSDSRLRSRAYNERVTQMFHLSEPLLDAIYAEPVVRYFYTPAEIAVFRARWSAPTVFKIA